MINKSFFIDNKNSYIIYYNLINENIRPELSNVTKERRQNIINELISLYKEVNLVECLSLIQDLKDTDKVYFVNYADKEQQLYNFNYTTIRLHVFDDKTDYLKNKTYYDYSRYILNEIDKEFIINLLKKEIANKQNENLGV